MIAYLDLPCGLTGEMLLGCLVDCGWPVARLRETVANIVPANVRWAVATQDVLKGSLRATSVNVMIDEEAGALEDVAIAAAIAAGLDELGVGQLHASRDPALAAISDSKVSMDSIAADVLWKRAQFVQPEMRLVRVGVGADHRDRKWPNIARLWLGELQ